MREIQFRVISRDTGKLLGYEWLDNGQWYHHCPELDPVHGIRKIRGVFEGEFDREQFAGLIDSRATKVVEGDILKDECGNITYIEWNDEALSGAQLNEMKANGEIEDYYGGIHSPMNGGIVIGNVRDNPDLLTP